MELLDTLEHQVIPLYFSRNGHGEPQGWVRKSKASMKSIMPRFNAQRMALDYVRDYYGPASRQRAQLLADEGAPSRKLAAWKKRTAECWSGIRIRMVSAPPLRVKHGHSVPIEVAVFLNELGPDDVVVECVLGKENELGEFIPTNSLDFTAAGRTLEGETLFRLDLCSPERGIPLPGLQSYKIRIYPYHPLLSHRFECGSMRWL